MEANKTHFIEDSQGKIIYQTYLKISIVSRVTDRSEEEKNLFRKINNAFKCICRFLLKSMSSKREIKGRNKIKFAKTNEKF